MDDERASRESDADAGHGYPPPLTAAGHVAPVPRRIRGFVDGTAAFDTTRALYVWEWPPYPQYYVPLADVDPARIVAAGEPFETPHGTARTYALRTARGARVEAARAIVASASPLLAGTIRFAWDAVDRWLEEDEEIFVHPRSPYVRVDALRSSRDVRIEAAGTVLAESSATVMVFETGLPTRFSFDATAVRFDRLIASGTRTACPYKGNTTGYWSARANGATIPDVAWTYAFPTRQLLPIAGLVAFLNEKVDTFVDGVAQPRPVTHMS